MFKNRNFNFIFIITICLLIASVVANIYFFPALRSISKRTDCKGCSVVLIDIDVLRADAIDCNKNRGNTPNLCKFMDNAVYFSDNASQSDLTINSMVSFLTSMYPVSHGVWNETFSTDLYGVTYLPELLSQSGYSTLLFEKSKNYIQVIKKGFTKTTELVNRDDKYTPETLFSGVNSSKPFFMEIYNDDLHFPYLTYSSRILTKSDRPNGVPRTTEEFWKKIEDYVKSNYRSIFTEEAINLNKNLFTDDINRNSKEILNLFDNYAEGPEKTRYLKNYWGPIKNAYFENVNMSDESLFIYLKEMYLSTLHVVDEQLGPLLTYLTDNNRTGKTIVIVMSNHGEEFYDHGGFSHENRLYQELIHTPLMIKAPNIKPAIISALTEDIDIMPTILDLLGIQIPPQSQGQSLLPLMRGNVKNIRDYQISQKGSADFFSVYRKNNWKIIMMKGYGLELYDLSADPGEKDNVIKKYPDISNMLTEEYKTKVGDILRGQKPENINIPVWMDPSKRERLKNEGYF